MLREAFGKSAATFDGEGEIADDTFQRRMSFLFYQNRQSAKERQTGVHERRQLTRKSGKNLGLNFPAQAGNLDIDIDPAALFARGLGAFSSRLGFFVGLFLGLGIDFDDLRRKE